MQQKLQVYLGDPSRVLNVKSGKRLQVLSPGTRNLHEGPDFLDAALLLNGSVVIGDIEYHRYASEWKSHGHGSDTRYLNVVLHVVSHDDTNLSESFETLVIHEDELMETSSAAPDGTDIRSQEDLQNMALVRLLRKTASAQKILVRHEELEESAREVYGDFLSGYHARRRRPGYDSVKLNGILEKLWSSKSFMLLLRLRNKEHMSVADELQSLLKTSRGEEGIALRREMIINCLLPLAICLADEKTRIDLFFWYWSATSINQYGALKRKFPDIPQNYIWQQQGMLEFMKEYGKRPAFSDIMKDYGFAEILSFYKIGRAPIAAILYEGE